MKRDTAALVYHTSIQVYIFSGVSQVPEVPQTRMAYAGTGRSRRSSGTKWNGITDIRSIAAETQSYMYITSYYDTDATGA